jgi:hypothetical protein
MKMAHDDIEQNMPTSKGSALEWLTKKISDLTSQKRSIDAEIAATKFAIVLGGHWFKHFKEDQASFQVNGYDVTLVLGTSTKKI